MNLTINSEVRHQLECALTVKDLIAELQSLPEDAAVVFACDYGDISHTQQALTVERVEELDWKYSGVVPSAYSQSRMAVEEIGTPEYDDLDAEERRELEQMLEEREETAPPVVVITCS